MSDKKWTADEVRDKLRCRHPATQAMGSRQVPGPWTCVEEWRCIDLLALCATSSGGRVPYARVGYEVKVDRADYRKELKEPGKRADAVGMCHEFYFAIPGGLLKPEEIEGTASGRAPLHVPDDVGLIVIDGRGCRVIKDAPINRSPDPIASVNEREPGDPFGADINALVRWVSARPDPRHDGVVEEARRYSRRLGELDRERREKGHRIERAVQEAA